MFKATHRLARISPRKVRPLADLVRGKLADEALDILRFQPHRGARLLEEVIKSAIGNSQDSEQNQGRAANQQALVVAEARVDGGPIIKRFRPRARGSAFPILKRTCHIHVTLEELQG
ncbi:50S ribosomal protein L22 [Bremerella cremea]|uniref:50S ribosomal protein L22 n=1 Tax=Bremerella cremea TaxID=1031537 RepID=UPI0031F19370